MKGIAAELTKRLNTGTELNRRVTTGAAGAFVLLFLIIWGGRIGVSLIGAVLSIAMLHEYVEITLSLPDKEEKRKMMLGSAWLIAFINFWVPRAEFELLLMTFLGFFGYFLFTAGRHPGEAFEKHFRELVYSVFGMLYLAFIPLFLPLLHDASAGMHWVILFLMIVWAGDTGAYFAGRQFGKHKLYPLISPKKSVEGAIGGLLAGVAVAVLYKLALFRGLSWGGAVVIPLFVGAVAQIGDLAESYLKRAYAVKDSGSILPGHGGFLDRFDGVLFGLPVMYGLIRVFGG